MLFHIRGNIDVDAIKDASVTTGKDQAANFDQIVGGGVRHEGVSPYQSGRTISLLGSPDELRLGNPRSHSGCSVGRVEWRIIASLTKEHFPTWPISTLSAPASV